MWLFTEILIFVPQAELMLPHGLQSWTALTFFNLQLSKKSEIGSGVTH